MTTLTINLPDNLAKEAQQAGLLAPRIIEGILRESLQKRAVDDLLAAADQLATADLPPMTMEEIQAEVNAVRAQKK